MAPINGSPARDGFVEMAFGSQVVRIESRWIGAPATGRPLLVFLHEGLGSVSMWRDFPERLCEAASLPGFVFSRRGYGRSTPPVSDERWRPDYMTVEAREHLPAVLRAAGIDHSLTPVILIGHSDGGSIALLNAAIHPDQVAGLVVIAPHIVVEDLTVRSIELARTMFEAGTLKAGLARHHDDPAATFWRWNQIWLSSEFRTWSIEREVANVRCPLLAVQGVDDPYGTMEQIRGIQRLAPQTRLIELPACGHSPHRDQPNALLAAIAGFLEGQWGRA